MCLPTLSNQDREPIYLQYQELNKHIIQLLFPHLHLLIASSFSVSVPCFSLLPPTLPQSNCAQYAADRREEEKMCDHLISAAKHRDHVTANQLKQKILNILTNKHGAWGTMSQRWAAHCQGAQIRIHRTSFDRRHCGTLLAWHEKTLLGWV